MKKSTFAIAALIIVLCITLNLVQHEDTSAMGIARDLFLQTRAQIDEKELGEAIGKVADGRRSLLAYRAAHTELNKNGYYKGLSEDHLPLLEVLVENLEADGYTSNAYVFNDRTAEILQKLELDSRAVGDVWK